MMTRGLFVAESVLHYDVWYDNTPGCLDSLGQGLIFKSLPESDEFRGGFTDRRL